MPPSAVLDVGWYWDDTGIGQACRARSVPSARRPGACCSARAQGSGWGLLRLEDVAVFDRAAVDTGVLDVLGGGSLIDYEHARERWLDNAAVLGDD